MATTKFYGKVFLAAFNKEIDLDSDTIKVMLLANTYTPNLNAHKYKSDLTGEVAGTGYTAGGVALSGVAVSYDVASSSFIFDANDVSWPGSTITAAYAVIYDSTPATDATRPLIALVDFAGNQSTTAGTLSIVWDATGIAAVTVS